MNFWNELTKNVSDAADKTAKGAEKLGETAKVKYRLSSLTNKQNEIYRTIGQLRYAEFDGEEVTPETYRPFCEEIRELSDKITACEKKLADLRGELSCERCGKRVKRDLRFCPHCGERILHTDNRKAKS